MVVGQTMLTGAIRDEIAKHEMMRISRLSGAVLLLVPVETFYEAARRHALSTVTA